MASVNKAIILGNLGQDPELRYTPSGAAVCTLNIATTDVRNDQNNGRQERTEWHRVVVWNKAAENAAKYLAKGRSVYIEGKIQTRSWEDQNGQKKYSTEIVAQTVQFLVEEILKLLKEVNKQETLLLLQQNLLKKWTQGFGGPNTPSLDEIPF